MHGEPVCVVMSAERYQVADRIAAEVMTIQPPGEGPQKKSLTDKIDAIALHPFFGYLAVIAVIGGLLGLDIYYRSTGLGVPRQYSCRSSNSTSRWSSGPLMDILWNGAFTGFVAGVTLVIPYVLPFYLLLAIIEDSGYLTRIAVMLDRGMHKLGLHGKAIIPLILGYGCNVPADLFVQDHGDAETEDPRCVPRYPRPVHGEDGCYPRPCCRVRQYLVGACALCVRYSPDHCRREGSRSKRCRVSRSG